VRVKSSTFTGGGSEFSISICAHELMNSRANGSEKNAGRTGMQKLSNQSRTNVLIGSWQGKEETARQEFAKEL